MANVSIVGVPKGGIWLKFTEKESVWTSCGWVKGKHYAEVSQDCKITVVILDHSNLATTRWYGGTNAPNRRVTSEKTKCDSCGTYGGCKLFDSDDDCKAGDITALPLIDEGKLLRRAWLGDAQHSLDVRMCLSMTNANGYERERSEIALTSDKARACWYSAFRGQKQPAIDQSEISKSIAFGASYCGVFRATYMADQLTLSGDINVSDEVVGFISAIPIAN